MGVRFACHSCGKRLNIKTELAGRRGICPDCSTRFRIPLHDCETSTPIEDRRATVAVAHTHQIAATTSGATATVVLESETKVASASSFHRAATTDQASGSTPDTASIPDTAPSQVPSSSHPDNGDLFGDATATWYVRPPSGGQYGPADGPTMRQWLSEGRVAETSMVWRDGWGDWRPAQSTFAASSAAPWSASSAVDRIAQSNPVGASAASPVVNAATASAPATSNPNNVSNQPVTAGVSVMPRAAALPSNHRHRSRKRMAATVVMILVFIGLVAALAVVLMR